MTSVPRSISSGDRASPSRPTTRTPHQRRPRPAAGQHFRSPLQRQYARLGWLFASPALLVVLAVTIFPIVFSVIMSVSHVTVSGTGFQLSGLTGDNYAVLLGSGRWAHAVIFTVVYAILTVTVEVVLGTMIALALEQLSAGRGMMMALLLLPWSMVTVISAELWAYIYNGAYGVLNAILEPIAGHSVNVLGTQLLAGTAMGVADVWKTTPFVAIIVLAGLVMLPSEVSEAAQVDGAGAWTIFWRVRLPLLRPTLAIAVLFRVLQAFGIFDLPFILTHGGPGNSTESLAILGWRAMFQDLKFGPGAAVATSTTAIVLIGCLVFLKVFRSQVGTKETSI